ncbi:expressed unknown protein [Seminavis robusta]|uniref:Uncharacterized protein n=1 Tax=Seminavis robusta TaxID=568900 RepID=A0A9N8DR28_9STRA|nr:expressed unknown protein [Seminavis robusta]|eukprot:Sro221_g090921.1  (112) ;mRNA; f:21957-22292
MLSAVAVLDDMVLVMGSSSSKQRLVKVQCWAAVLSGFGGWFCVLELSLVRWLHPRLRLSSSCLVLLGYALGTKRASEFSLLLNKKDKHLINDEAMVTFLRDPRFEVLRSDV